MRYIDEFLDTEAPQLLDKLDAAQLADIVDGLARRLDELPKALGGAVAPHWDEIVSRSATTGTGGPARRRLCRKLSVADVRGLFYSSLARDGAARRPVLVVADRGKPPSSPSKDAIPDAAAWASKLEAGGRREPPLCKLFIAIYLLVSYWSLARLRHHAARIARSDALHCVYL